MSKSFIIGLGHTHNALEDFNIVNLTTSGLEGVRVQVPVVPIASE